MDFEAILTEAHAAAAKAQEGMVENMNALDCGFAWVVVDGSDPLARACRKAIKAKAKEFTAQGVSHPDQKAESDMRPFWGSKGYPSGWHGTKVLWRIRKWDELDALDVTIQRLAL